MPRSKIPEGELANFIVKTRYLSSQSTEQQKNLTLIRNMANRMFRDHIGYTLTGEHRIKEKGEPVFAQAVARDARRQPRSSAPAGPKSHVRYLGEGSFLWEGSKVLVLGIPPALKSVEKVDYLVADRFSPALREPMLELMGRYKPMLIALPEVVAEATLRGFNAHAVHLGGGLSLDGITIQGVNAQSSEDLAPCSFVVEMSGTVLYHAGRSALTHDMQVVGDLFHVDVMTVPLGLTLPMSFWAAARAVEWVGARWVLPWTAEEGVFPKELQKHLGDTARVKVLAANETWEVARKGE